MNTEKGVAVASVVLLAIMSLASWQVRPELKKIGEHRREGLHPIRSDSGVALESPDVLAYIALAGNPFMWVGEIPVGPEPRPDDGNGEKPPVKPPPVKPPVKPPPVKPPPVKPPPVKPPPVKPPPTREWKLPIAYVGTVKVQGSRRPRQAIFKDTETGKYMKLTKGEEYKKVKLIEVKSNSVILLNEKGKRFVLPQR